MWTITKRPNYIVLCCKILFIGTHDDDNIESDILQQYT